MTEYSGDYNQQQQAGYYAGNPGNYDQNYSQSYDIGQYPADPQFGGDQYAANSQYEQYPQQAQDTQFQQFDYSQQAAPSYDQAGFMAPTQDMSRPVTSVPPFRGLQSGSYTGQIMQPDSSPAVGGYGGPGVPGEEDYENEPPLMEELGINFEHIKAKTLGVLNPMQKPDITIMQDTDLAGPLVFCFAFGASLMLAGKIHFGYIYGIGVIGCFAMYALLNMMSTTPVPVGITVSVLGYCLLPMVILAWVAIAFSLQGIIGTVLTAIAVVWCSICASKFFVTALGMDHQQLLVAYPCALVYGVFALLTVF